MQFNPIVTVQFSGKIFLELGSDRNTFFFSGKYWILHVPQDQSLLLAMGLAWLWIGRDGLLLWALGMFPF